jgi:hypothetical protein
MKYKTRTIGFGSSFPKERKKGSEVAVEVGKKKERKKEIKTHLFPLHLGSCKKSQRDSSFP